MIERVWRGVKAASQVLWSWTISAARAVWSVIRRPVLFALNIIAALIILFEEWGWRPLAAALAWFARFKPIAKIEAAIAELPPYPSLLVFALPTTLLFPLKLVALWLIASGKVLSASALFIAAKVASTALIARIFMLTKPALMRIGWFERGYNLFMPWKERLFAVIRESWVWRYGRIVKAKVMQRMRRVAETWRPLVKQQVAALRRHIADLWDRLFGRGPDKV